MIKCGIIFFFLAASAVPCLAVTAPLIDTTAAANGLKSTRYLHLQLAKDAINTDDIMILFKRNTTNGYDLNQDATYFQGNGQINLNSISSDNVNLAINALPLPPKSVTIKLRVMAKASGSYKLNLTQLVNMPALFEVWLIDAYKKDSLDMRRKSTYSFDLLKTDTNTYGSGRFSLVIRQNPALSVKLLDFGAIKENTTAKIVWTTANEQDYTSFTVERSTDNGITFKVIDSLSSSGAGTYSSADKAPVKGADQYRLKVGDLAGTISYSAVTTLMYGDLSNTLVNNTITVYPNPASGTLNLTIHPVPSSNNATTMADSPDSNSTAEAGTSLYLIKIFNTNGSVIKTTTTDQQTSQTDVSNLSPGTYIIHVLNNKDNSVVGKGTFIKL